MDSTVLSMVQNAFSITRGRFLSTQEVFRTRVEKLRTSSCRSRIFISDTERIRSKEKHILYVGEIVRYLQEKYSFPLFFGILFTGTMIVVNRCFRHLDPVERNMALLFNILRC